MAELENTSVSNSGNVYISMELQGRDWSGYTIHLSDEAGFYTDTIYNPTQNYTYSYNRDDATDCIINISVDYPDSVTNYRPVPVIEYMDEGSDRYVYVRWTVDNRDGDVYVNIDFTSHDFSGCTIHWTDNAFLSDTISNPTEDYAYSGGRDDAIDTTIEISGYPDDMAPIIKYNAQAPDLYIAVTWKKVGPAWVIGTPYVYTNGAWVPAKMYRHDGTCFVTSEMNVYTSLEPSASMTTESNAYGTTVIMNKYTTEANDHGTTVVIG